MAVAAQANKGYQANMTVFIYREGHGCSVCFRCIDIVEFQHSCGKAEVTNVSQVISWLEIWVMPELGV